jgi:hypothetical protein
MPVGPAELALYSANNSGAGQALALNEDGMLNSPLNPASARSREARGFYGASDNESIGSRLLCFSASCCASYGLLIGCWVDIRNSAMTRWGGQGRAVAHIIQSTDRGVVRKSP